MTCLSINRGDKGKMFYLHFESIVGEEKIKGVLFSIFLNPEEGSLSRLAKAMSLSGGSNCKHERKLSCMATDCICPGNPACPQGSSMPIRRMAQEETGGLRQRCTNCSQLVQTKKCNKINYFISP